MFDFVAVWIPQLLVRCLCASLFWTMCRSAGRVRRHVSDESMRWLLLWNHMQCWDVNERMRVSRRKLRDVHFHANLHRRPMLHAKLRRPLRRGLERMRWYLRNESMLRLLLGDYLQLRNVIECVRNRWRKLLGVPFRADVHGWPL